MAHQIVATSVPRGLDGVSGYQTVLKSKGIPPRVFDRLKARAGYSHPYSHGDPRNPVVYLHRIEELAGSRWHVLGCIRDAGSDHTGRSNFLAHMLGIEAGEARSKPGGPAAAAMAGGCFLSKWDGPPDGTALPKTLVAADVPPLAGDLPAWTAAGLDPGVAGDLAAAAMRNDKVVLVTRQSEDVLALFADALRLVEPSKRWGVTFNTCAVEDFDGTWKAVRNDLVDTKQLSTGRTAVIDLTAGERGSEDPYAQFARGETSSLPWQKVSRAVAAPLSGPAAASSPELPLPLTGHPVPADARHATPEPRPAVSSPSRERGGRPRYIEEDKLSRVPWQLITIACLFLLIGGSGAAIAYRDQLFGLIQPVRPRTSALDRELADAVDLPSAVSPPPRGEGPPPALPEQVGGTVSLKEASDRLAKKRSEVTQQLENGTYGFVRTQISDLLTKVGELRGRYAAEWESLVTSDRTHQDPTPAIDQIRQAFDALDAVVSDVDKVLGSRILAPLGEIKEKQATLTAVEDDLALAVAGVDGVQAQVNHLEAALREKQTETRQEEAFKEFQTLSKAVSLPVSGWQQLTDIGGPATGAGDSKEIDLGPFRIADLVDPQVRLAVPRDLDDGDSIKLVPVDKDPTVAWEIRYLSGRVGLNGTPQQPRVLASLSANDGRLLLEPAKLKPGLGSLLRRCVVVLEARQPDSAESERARQAIRLVEPTCVSPLVIDVFESAKQPLAIEPPKGISRSVGGGSSGVAQLLLPINSVRLEWRLMSGETTLDAFKTDFFKDGPGAALDGVSESEAMLYSANSVGWDIGIRAVMEMTLPRATATVRTNFSGSDMQKFGGTDAARRQNVRKFFARNRSGAAASAFREVRARFQSSSLDINTMRDGKQVEQWFATRLTVPDNFGMDMSGHETRRDSFELFLQERTSQAKAAGKETSTLPKDFEEFKASVALGGDSRWGDTFEKPVNAWLDWFWEAYEVEWRKAEEMWHEACEQQYQMRVDRFASLAYDENGEEYEVPLVVLDESAGSAGSAGGPDSSGGVGTVGLE